MKWELRDPGEVGICRIKNNALINMTRNQLVNSRNVDDIFLVVNNISTLHELKPKIELISVLKIIFKIEMKNHFHSLMCSLSAITKVSCIPTFVNAESTNTSECLNN